MNMRPLTKSKAYELLFKISKKQNLNIDKYIEILSKSGDTIPVEVILFINKHNGSTIPQLKVFNIIYSKRRTNHLYRTIMNESATPDEQCLALNSMITQCLIQIKDLRLDERDIFIDIMNVQDLLSAVSGYLLEGDTKKLRTIFFEVRSIFKNLFKNEQE